MPLLNRRIRLTQRRSFTLLEIFLCLAILALLGGVLGWHAKQAVGFHRFQNNVNQLASQLRHLQILALSYQTDINLKLYWDNDGTFTYDSFTDEKIKILKTTKPVPLGGIEKATYQENKKMKKLKKPYIINILSSGRIEPTNMIGFHRNNDLIWINLTTPLQIKLEEKKHEID